MVRQRGSSSAAKKMAFIGGMSSGMQGKRCSWRFWRNGGKNVAKGLAVVWWKEEDIVLDVGDYYG